MFNRRFAGIGLMEVLVTLAIVGMLSLLFGYVVRAMDTIKAQQANKIAQASMQEVQEAYTKYLADGGWVQNTTHVTHILDHLNFVQVVTDGSQINGLTPTTTLTCNGTSNVVCYRMRSGAMIATRPFNASITGDNGYFTTTGASAGVLVGGIPTHSIHVDPDGVVDTTNANSATLHMEIDAQGRMGVKSSDGGILQPAYLDMEK